MTTPYKKIKIAVMIAAIFLYTAAEAQLQPPLADSFYLFLKSFLKYILKFFTFVLSK